MLCSHYIEFRDLLKLFVCVALLLYEIEGLVALQIFESFIEDDLLILSQIG